MADFVLNTISDLYFSAICDPVKSVIVFSSAYEILESCSKQTSFVKILCRKLLKQMQDFFEIPL